MISTYIFMVSLPKGGYFMNENNATDKDKLSDEIEKEEDSDFTSNEGIAEDFYHESYSSNSSKSNVFNGESDSSNMNPLRFILIILMITIIGGFSVGSGYKLTDYYILGNKEEVSIKYVPKLEQTNSKRVTSDQLYSVTEIAKKVGPSVVSITNEIIQDNIFGTTTGVASGSGVIFDITNEKIYILTNNHVIADSNGLSVNFFGDENYIAKIIGYDSDSDLAVISVDKNLITDEIENFIQPIVLGNSANLEVGEIAVAVGNPLGYSNTVTAGIISAVDRIISSDLNALSLIQTDAAINPGNSGGALVNSNAELIGINTIKISDTAVEGIGFAIPINSAIPILEEILDKGYVSRPFIGIWGGDISKEAASEYNIPLGVVVTDIIPESPASESGLRKFDIIVRIDDYEITSMESLNRVISLHEIGDVVSIEIRREVGNGDDKKFEVMKLKLTIGDRHAYTK